MIKRAETKQGGHQRATLHRLIQQQGLRQGEYSLFFVSGEGRFLPISKPGDIVEETSGFVLNREGRVFSFWLAWDAERDGPALTRWKEVPSESHWQRSAEYRDARQKLGLSVG